MCLKTNENIGIEIHNDTDQWFRFESDEGFVMTDAPRHIVKDGTGRDD